MDANIIKAGFMYNKLEDDKIILVNPTIEQREQLIEYKEEHYNEGENIIHACSK